MHPGSGIGKVTSTSAIRGRQSRYQNYIDRRPTTINATGFEREDKQEVLTHFTVRLAFV